MVSHRGRRDHSRHHYRADPAPPAVSKAQEQLGIALRDYLIVGQGLAGSLLAWELIRRGRSVLVVDDAHSEASSMAAAGMINPVTGIRLTKTPRIDTYLPQALQTYRQQARQFHKQFYYPRPMLRLFGQTEEAERWRRRRIDPDYAGWLGREFASEQAPWPCLAACGGYHQPHAGYLEAGASLPGWADIRRYAAHMGTT